jgi:hypothetical protein
VEHRDPRPFRVHDPLRWEEPTHVRAVHVAVHPDEWRSDRLELPQHLERREVAGVQQEIGAGDPLDASIRQPPRAARQVRIG